MTQQEFIIKSLRPYFEEPLLCGISEHEGCSYRGRNGTKCVVGQHIPDENYMRQMEGLRVLPLIGNMPDLLFAGKPILSEEAQKMCLPLAAWDTMQTIHDHIAVGQDKGSISNSISRLEGLTNTNLQELRDLLN